MTRRGAGDAAEDSSALHQQLAYQEASACSGPPPASPKSQPGAQIGYGSHYRQHPLQPGGGGRTLKEHYGLSSLDGLGLPEYPLALQALGGRCATSRTPSSRKTAAFP